MSKQKRPQDTYLADVSLPKSYGTYALLLHLPCSISINFSRFGFASFPPGWLIYVGSAFGAGGIRARVGRHLRLNKAQHWHIDWLLPHARICGFWYSTTPTHLECTWCQGLIKLDDATIPLPGFGSGDCQAHCPAHLIALGESPFPRLTHILKRALSEGQASVQFQSITTSPIQDPTMPVHLVSGDLQQPQRPP